MIVPGGIPHDFFSIILPLLILISVPSLVSFSFVFNRNLLTEAIEGSASPLNPNVIIRFKSLESFNLLVACLSKQIRASSEFIPIPLSLILIKFFPAFLISISIRSAFASMLFSISSFIIPTGLSITSPAAIWFATWSVSILILDIVLLI